MWTRDDKSVSVQPKKVVFFTESKIFAPVAKTVIVELQIASEFSGEVSNLSGTCIGKKIASHHCRGGV